MPAPLIDIDGSDGEGGGQMLRTSLGLSMVTGRAFRIHNIRANRDNPGLARQHLTAVLAAQQVCAADVTGAAVGSRDLTFTPGRPSPGAYHFDIGTAGSTTLVFQAVLPALLRLDAPSVVTLVGGTHNAHAPPLDFLDRGFLPVVNRQGPRVSLTVERLGFYPAGGGRWRARVDPAPALTPLRLDVRGHTTRCHATALVARLPADVARRELDRVTARLRWRPDQLAVRELADQGPGNAVLLEIESEHVTELFSGIGARGVRAEAVADAAIDEAHAYLATDVPVGPHLADQLLIPLALAGGGGSFVTGEPTLHTRTNVDVIRKFLGDDALSLERIDESRWRAAALDTQ